MVAVGRLALARLERDQEKVAPVEVVQDRRRVAASGDRGARVWRELGQNRRLQQEHAHERVLMVEHLLREVVEEVAISLRDVLEKAAARMGIGDALQRRGQQAKSCYPALGARMQ